MNDEPQYCQRCGQRLDPSKIVWLELDRRTNTYTDAENIPDEHNQGAFPFGAACAKKELVGHAKAQVTA